jgi:hypothetical protein
MGAAGGVHGMGVITRRLTSNTGIKHVDFFRKPNGTQPAITQLHLASPTNKLVAGCDAVRPTNTHGRIRV